MAWIQSPVAYAALGDSLSIDDYAGGPGRGAASLLWRNRDRDFPAWAGRNLTARDPAVRAGIAGHRKAARWPAQASCLTHEAVRWRDAQARGDLVVGGLVPDCLVALVFEPPRSRSGTAG
jgi:hypothetical protein